MGVSCLVEKSRDNKFVLHLPEDPHTKEISSHQRNFNGT